MDMLIFDLASLRYQWNATRTALSALSARGELLAVVDAPAGADGREAAFDVCDAALDRGRISRPGDDGLRTRYRVALYNPYSAEVSVQSVPHTKVFSAGTRLTIPASGLAAVLEVVDDTEQLRAGDVVLARRHPDFSALTRAYSSHRDS